MCARLHAIRIRQKLVRMFDEWHDSAVDESSMQNMIDQAKLWGLRKWMNKNLWGSFASWLSRTRAMSLAILAVENMKRASYRQAFKSWRQSVALSITRAEARSAMAVRVDVVMKIRSAISGSAISDHGWRGSCTTRAYRTLLTSRVWHVGRIAVNA